MNVLARLKPGMTLEAARADLSVTLKREQQEFPRASMGKQVNMVGFNENLVGDVRPALLALLGAMVFVLLAGIFPAVQATKADVHQTLKTQSAAASALSRRGGGVRRGLPALMIAELALALVLLVGAGLMIKSFLRLLAVPKGFNPEGVLTLALTPSLAKYPQESPRRLAYFEESLARVQALPGVQSVTLTTFPPLGGPQIRMFLEIEGRPPSEPGNEPIVETNHISPDYFQTMGIPLLLGRTFTTEDRAGTPKVVVINE